MASKGETGILTLYSDVQATAVRWLWYPFIAVGKITLLQGDPGDGKSTMMMNLIAELSKGGKLPDGKAVGLSQRVIYQCSEDGVSDTIKPRLEKCGADCRNAGAHRVGKLNEFSSCEIKCVAFVRMVYKDAKWNKRRSYRMIGNPSPEQRLVSFQIQDALPIENGRVLDKTGSPTFALCREESSSAQNNPTSEEKADSGAV